jgi:hypothetical protein
LRDKQQNLVTNKTNSVALSKVEQKQREKHKHLKISVLWEIFEMIYYVALTFTLIQPNCCVLGDEKSQPIISKSVSKDKSIFIKTIFLAKYEKRYFFSWG